MSKNNKTSNNTISGNEFNTKAGKVGIGFALGSGMARGFAHIGVLKVLQRNGIQADIVAGTSIGSVVGGAYLAGKLDELEEWALSLNRFKILSYLDLRVRSAGMIGGKKLEDLLEANFKDMAIEDLAHPFVAICTDLVTGREIWVRKGNLIQAMKASFALPGVFPPVERSQRFLVDGALVNPVPVSVCQASGARLTIGVDLNADIVGKAARANQKYQTVTGFDLFDDRDVPPSEQKKHSTSFAKRMFKREENSPSLFGVMVSSLGIMMTRMTRSRMAGDPPDIHIKPQIGHIGLLEFEKAAELIEQGEIAATRALPDIRAAMEVFMPATTEAE